MFFEFTEEYEELHDQIARVILALEQIPGAAGVIGVYHPSRKTYDGCAGGTLVNLISAYGGAVQLIAEELEQTSNPAKIRNEMLTLIEQVFKELEETGEPPKYV